MVVDYYSYILDQVEQLVVFFSFEDIGDIGDMYYMLLEGKRIL